MLLALSNYLRDTPEAPFACMAQINAIFAILLGGTPYRVLSDTENMTQTRNAERMHRILHYLETHYSEPVRLSEIAEREGLTQTYLSHLFREQLHIPFQDYLGRLRLEAAMLLLRQSDTTLTDAAYACGFSDPKYLEPELPEKPRNVAAPVAAGKPPGPEPATVRRGLAYSAAYPDARRVPGAAGCAGIVA
ncbi:MAG: helix-turn-helix transcriptional regulator [Acutalibacteraceae bacterium]